MFDRTKPSLPNLIGALRYAIQTTELTIPKASYYLVMIGALAITAGQTDIEKFPEFLKGILNHTTLPHGLQIILQSVGFNAITSMLISIAKGDPPNKEEMEKIIQEAMDETSDYLSQREVYKALKQVTDYQGELYSKLEYDIAKGFSDQEIMFRHFQNQILDKIEEGNDFVIQNLSAQFRKIIATPNVLQFQLYPIRAQVINAIFEIKDKPSKLFGRNEELKTILKYLSDKGKVLLHGFPGEGKTALASWIAALEIDHHSKPILWINPGQGSYETIIDAIVFAFTGKENEGDNKISKELHINRLLYNNNITLIVIDNVLNDEFLETFLSIVPEHIRILITSQSRLSLIDAEPIQLEKLSQTAALALLESYAGAQLQNDPHAKELCKWLDYHAYALEIAGRTIKTEYGSEGFLPPVVLLDRIKKIHPSYLSNPSSKQRHENIAALIDESLSHTSEDTRDVFLAFGAFESKQTSSEMLRLYFEQTGRVLDTDTALAELNRRGLLQHGYLNGTSRLYYIIENLAYDYCTSKISKESIKYKLFACLNYIAQYCESTTDNRTAISPELTNCIDAATWALEQGYNKQVIEFIRCLYRGSELLIHDGLHILAADLLKQGIEAAQRLRDHDIEASLWSDLGVVQTKLAQYDSAIKSHNKALAINKITKNEAMEAKNSRNLGIIYFNRGDYELADEYFAKSREIFHQLGDFSNEIRTRIIAANVYNDQSEYQRAITTVNEAYKIFDEVSENIAEGDKIILKGVCLGIQGIAYRESGNPDRAWTCFEQALPLFEKAGSTTNVANVLNDLGNVLHDQNQHHKSIEYYSKSLEIYTANDELRGRAVVLIGLGNAYIELGQIERGIEHLSDALEITQLTEEKTNEGIARKNLAEAYCKSGDLVEATKYWKSSNRISEDLNLKFLLKDLAELASEYSLSP